MNGSIRRIDIAGRDVTEYLQLLFRKAGYVFSTSAEKEVVRTIKEKASYIASDYKKEEKEWQQFGGKPEGKIVEYVLPDGHKMKVRNIIPHIHSFPTEMISRLAPNVSAPPKSSLIPRSSAANIRASTRSLSTPSTAPIWT